MRWRFAVFNEGPGGVVAFIQVSRVAGRSVNKQEINPLLVTSIMHLSYIFSDYRKPLVSILRQGVTGQIFDQDQSRLFQDIYLVVIGEHA